MADAARILEEALALDRAGSHAIFYRIAERGDLLIVRVLHARMLPELHLGTEGDE